MSRLICFEYLRSSVFDINAQLLQNKIHLTFKFHIQRFPATGKAESLFTQSSIWYRNILSLVRMVMVLVHFQICWLAFTLTTLCLESSGKWVVSGRIKTILGEVLPRQFIEIFRDILLLENLGNGYPKILGAMDRRFDRYKQ